MLIAASLLTLTAQVAVGPVVPPGANYTFHTTVLAVEERLFASDFAGAAKVSHALPKSQLKIRWDDSKVPPRLRQEFAQMRDQATAAIARLSKGKLTLVKSAPDVLISFEPVLPPAVGAKIPAGAVLFWSDAPGEPRLEVVIGLKRGVPPEPIDSANVYNEIAHALGSYYGLATTEFGTSITGRTDENVASQTVLGPNEMALATKTITVAEELRKAVATRQRLAPARPKAFFEPTSVQLEPAIQGEKARFGIQVTNTGNAQLHMRISADCGCITSTTYESLDPGESSVVKASFDTINAFGNANHNVFFVTNDSERLLKVVPVKLFVKPRYRLLVPTGNVLVTKAQSATADVFLVVESGDLALTPVSATVTGLPGSVKFAPWSGSIVDPEMGSEALPKGGFKFTMTLDGPFPPGRIPATLNIRTLDPDFKQIRRVVFVQSGIVALPERVSLGEIGKSIRRASFILSRPGKPFKVTSSSSDWPHAKVAHRATGDGTEHKVTVIYDGKANPGLVRAAVSLRTNDASQPLITVPLRATVR